MTSAREVTRQDISVRHGGNQPPLRRDSLADLLRLNAQRHGDRPALLLPENDAIESITYSGLLKQSGNLARWLLTRCGPGDRVVIWSNNAVESILLQHACALAGLIVAHFNTGWTDAEARHAIEKIGPAIGFAGHGHKGMDFGPRLRALADFEVVPLGFVDEIASQTHPGELPMPDADTPYLIQFTSGTTGKAKGALISQGGALYGGWIRPAVYGGSEHDIWLNAVPYHHIGGSIAILLGALATASAVVVLERYDRDQIVRLMRQLRPTRMGGVPTMWHDILASPELPSDRAVKIVTLGGASVPPNLVREVGEKTGALCAIGYGQSESGAITGTTPEDPVNILCETIGRPSPHTEVMIADPETGDPLPLGEVGEICARSPGNMMGYWGDTDATARTIRPDGFLRTGDLGSMDGDGYLRFSGRLREVIIRGGENIYPAEVEEALTSHPAISAAAAVKVDHHRLGHEVGAVVTLAEGAEADFAAFEAHAARHVAHFKVPRHWRVVDALPLTASGKVRKVELEALFRSGV